MLEQKRIFGHIPVTNGERQHHPPSRGEVAALEQMNILQQAVNHKELQTREPRNIGEVAIQEQMKIFAQLITTDIITEA